MKTSILSVFASILCFTACSKSIPEVEKDRQKYTVQFYIQPSPEILPFHSTKSIPGNIPPEPGASTPGEEDKAALFTEIEYAVYNTETSELIRHKQFPEGQNEDEEFGTYLYDEFEAGSYTVCILAHSSEDRSFADNMVSFNNISDAFYATTKIDIDKEQDKTVDIILSRVVSRIEFAATDDIPESGTQFHIQISGIYDTFNLFTGEAENSSKEHSIQYTFTETDKQNSPKYKTSFLTFVPTAPSAQIKEVTLKTFDSNDKMIHHQTLSNIPIYTNQTTRYTGTLFPIGLTNGTFELSVEENGAWGEDVVYPGV